MAVFSFILLGILAFNGYYGHWAVTVILLVITVATAKFDIEAAAAPCPMVHHFANREEKIYDLLCWLNQPAAFQQLQLAKEKHARHCLKCGEW